MPNLSVGIVGLPNVGKSTLFNALLGRQVADASNYPFCTIDPNVGVVEVPDANLSILAKVVPTEKIVPAVVEFVDIAGLVKGAAQGQGLGNKFLTHIRDCQAICHVLRFFTDPNVVKEGSLDPQNDIEVIFTELILKDLETIDKFIEANKKNLSQQKKFKLASCLKAELEKGRLAVNLDFSPDQLKLLAEFHLLTAKPFFIVANVDESSYQNIAKSKLRLADYSLIPVCAKIESDLSQLSPPDRQAYLASLGLKKSGLERVVHKAYQVLNLQSFYTVGPKEIRAWTIKKGSTALRAAGVIHTDFQKGFIKAEVVSLNDFVACGGWQSAKNAGKVRLEGRDYQLKPDDIILFRFNV